uniref:HMG box domain-containing protein n=1 Tax=Panagrellus redivivus TaxID=6233 RepID=A0A7E4ZQA0_PANRE
MKGQEALRPFGGNLPTAADYNRRKQTIDVVVSVAFACLAPRSQSTHKMGALTTMPPKRRRSPSSNESSSDSEPELPPAAKKELKELPWFDMRDLIVNLLQTCGPELKKYGATANVAAIIDKYPTLAHFKPLVESPQFPAQWKLLYAKAIRQKNNNLDTTTLIMQNFLDNGSNVHFFEDFPKKPKRAIDYYVAERKQPTDTVSDTARYRQAFTKDPNIQKYRDLAIQDRRRFRDELILFHTVNDYRLTDAQKAYVQKRMKTVDPDEKEKRKKAAAKSKQLTALDWFKKVNADEYEALPVEKREKRLLKAFSKLTPGELSIYEKLAQK